MFFIEHDVMRLLSPIPPIVIGKQNSAKRFIATIVRNGDELKQILAQYPTLRYEHLDQHYALLRCLGGLCEELVSDLCSCSNPWGGVVWASLLTILAPDIRYRKYLATANERAPRNQWLVALALAEIDGVQWDVDPEFQLMMRRLRAQLSPLRLPATIIRRQADAQQLLKASSEREAIKAIYRSSGLEAARDQLRRSEVLLSQSPMPIAPPRRAP